MTFKFPVLTDEEIQKKKEEALNLMPKGIYSFQVLKAEDHVSNKSGKHSIKLNLMVWDDKGLEHWVTDYLIPTETMVYKIKHFCESVGLDYNSGEMKVEQLEGLRGHADIIIQKGKPKDDGSGENYLDKNAVKDYVKRNTPSPADIPNDDLPF